MSPPAPRGTAFALTALTLATAFAGCLGGAGQATVSGGGPDATAAPAAALPTAWQVAEWSGHLQVGFAAEGPAHLEETGALVEPLWKSSFTWAMAEVPTNMQVRLDWEGGPALIQLMVVEPRDPGPVVHTTEDATEPPLCIRIPPEALRPGEWTVMVHSKVAAEVTLRAQVETVGGAGQVEEPHRMAAADFPGNVLRQETPPPLPCDP